LKADNQAERLAKQFFQVHGYTVHRIARDQEARRADFLAERGSEQVLLEVTEKEATGDFVELQSEARDRGLATLSRPIRPWNRIDGLLRDKAKQLEETPSNGSVLRVVWFSASHGDAEYVLDATLRTAFGLRNLFVFTASGGQYPKPCFYYEHSTFFRTRSIDGLILESCGGAILCINSYSPMAAELSRATLSGVFPPGTVIDPLALEAQGRAFVLDAPIDRSDPRAKWQAIVEKYGVKTAATIDSQFVGLVTFDSASCIRDSAEELGGE